MTEYCTENDLVKVRPDIMDLGRDDWADQIEEAGVIIDRAIETGWYRRIAEENGVDWRENPFDRDLLSMTQLVRLGCYKTLELIYLFLMKNTQESDAFERQHLLFKKMYSEELREVLDAGIDYDWDEDSVVEAGESRIPHVVRLVRV